MSDYPLVEVVARERARVVAEELVVSGGVGRNDRVQRFVDRSWGAYADEAASILAAIRAHEARQPEPPKPPAGWAEMSGWGKHWPRAEEEE